MVSEIEYTRAINRKGWSFIIKKNAAPFLIGLAITIFAKHTELHQAQRCKTFYNRSKMFGGLKNPQY